MAAYPEGAEDAWYAENGDNLANWHSQVEQWTNNGYANLNDVATDPQGFLAPQTAEFNTLFNDLVGKKNNETEGGTRFYDRSSLVHVHGEKIFKPWWADEIRLGANMRRYTPDSDGTIFSDTNGRVITNQEVGLYTGIKRHFLEDKLIATATMRADKNQNFNLVVSPAASLGVDAHAHRLCPTELQLGASQPHARRPVPFLDVGPATLVGNLKVPKIWSRCRVSLTTETALLEPTSDSTSTRCSTSTLLR